MEAGGAGVGDACSCVETISTMPYPCGMERATPSNVTRLPSVCGSESGASVREASSNTKCHSGRRTVRTCVYEVISNVTRVYVVTRHNICTLFAVHRGDLSTTKVESRWLV